MKRAIANLVDNAAEAMQDSLLKEIHISTALHWGARLGRDRGRRHRTRRHFRGEGETVSALLLHQEARDRTGSRHRQPHRGRSSRVDSRGREFSRGNPIHRRVARGPGNGRGGCASKMQTILIVDDESQIRSSLQGVLEDEGYKTLLAGSGEECLDMLRHKSVDVVLLDIWLPGIDGLETLEKLVETRRPSRSHHDLRTRQHRDRGARHQAGRLRFSREAALHRAHADRSEERHRSQAPAQREPGIQEAVPGAQRHRRRQHSDEGAAPADRADGADQRPRADLRRVGHRQGTGGARHPRAEPAQRRHVRRGQLRRHSRRPHRERAVRPSQGRILRRRRRQRRQIPEGRRRNAVPRRSRRHEPEDAVQGAAHARRRALCAGRRGRADHGGRARDRRHQQGSGRGNLQGQFSRRSFLPAERDSRSTCRRCASARKTFRCWRAIS